MAISKHEPWLSGGVSGNNRANRRKNGAIVAKCRSDNGALVFDVEALSIKSVARKEGDRSP